MNFLNKIFGKKEVTDLMDFAPFLTPWYIHQDKPKLFKDGKQLSWTRVSKIDTENVDVNVLEDNNRNCYAIFNIYNYILPSSDNTSFLIWDRDLEKNILGLQSLNIFYYSTDDLQPFVDRDNTILMLKQNKKSFKLAVKPTNKIKVDFDPTKDAMKFDFPEDFKKFGEFIFITELPNLYDNPNPDKYWHNTSMIDFKTKEGWIFNYPQDWFNKSNCDFGYQWITRAVRNPETKLIHGQGIRISDFILDETNRQQLNKTV
ncbi:MAG TPA: hypothetical protein VIJ75_15620 [Hanamia sp.]